MRLVIQDTGVGIPADQLPHIFEAFRQVDGSFVRRHHGTGLGLTITREVARAMGGEVSCVSEEGRGSVFTIAVPLPSAQAPVSANGAAQAGAHHAHSVGTYFTAHVLLVEDNAVNALVAEATLRRFGLSVTRVENGLEALALLCDASRPHHLVLMDLHMPELDGMAACRRLRQWESEHGVTRVPVVALTANALSSDRAQCLAAGMDDHLGKPFLVEQLLAVLQCHLAAHASEWPDKGHKAPADGDASPQGSITV